MKPILRLFGVPTVSIGDTEHALPWTKPALLLLFLAATGSWVSRERLAYLFRADSPEAVARHYVRNLLNRARRLPGAAVMECEAARCRWSVDTDVSRFKRAVSEERWSDAISDYSGRFLEGLEPDEGGAFATWLDATRDDLHRVWQHATLSYAAAQEACGQHDHAAKALAAYLQSDSLNETMVQSLIRNLYLTGDRDAALRAAERFLRELTADLAVEPLTETIDLVGRIREGYAVEPRTADPRSQERAGLGRRRGGSSDFQDLLDLLKDPSNRFLTFVESERGTGDSILISHKVPQRELALFAVVDLAETLIIAHHHERAVELLVMVMANAPAQAHSLQEKVARLWDRLAPHVPEMLMPDVQHPS